MKNKNKKPSILWHSEIINNTGFSQVTRNLVNHLKNDFDITVLDWQKQFLEGSVHKPKQMDGYKLLGCIQKAETFAGLQMQHMDLDKFDMVFILNDVWNTAYILQLLKYKKYRGRVVCYFPVDSTCHDSEWYQDFDMVSAPVTYTEFAREEVLKVAPGLKERLSVVQHGINSNSFYAIRDKSKEALREELFGTGAMNDKFIFLNANRNQSRKRPSITLEAFTIFAKDKPDVRLYMHCGNEDASINVIKLAQRLGIDDKLIITGGVKTKGLPNIDDKDLNIIYNICDVGLNSGMAEGWGLCNFEHASIGKPQIVPNHSACKELFYGISPLINCVSHFMHNDIMTVGQLVSVKHMADLMEKLYQDKDYYQQCATACAEKFGAQEYQWQHIAEQWRAIFNGTE